MSHTNTHTHTRRRHEVYVILSINQSFLMHCLKTWRVRSPTNTIPNVRINDSQMEIPSLPGLNMVSNGYEWNNNNNKKQPPKIICCRTMCVECSLLTFTKSINGEIQNKCPNFIESAWNKFHCHFLTGACLSFHLYGLAGVESQIFINGFVYFDYLTMTNHWKCLKK